MYEELRYDFMQNNNHMAIVKVFTLQSKQFGQRKTIQHAREKKFIVGTNKKSEVY